MSVPRLNLAEYREIVVLTGAGISAASGLHTYRGKGGLWEEHDVGRNGTAAALREDPDRVWRFFSAMREEVSDASPNPGHLVLAKVERELPPGSRLTVITQNIDGLHRAAGSGRVVELHGSLQRVRCTACTYSRAEVPADRSGECPTCPECGAPLRPDVVLFDEPLPVDAEWESKKVLRDCDLFLAVGTSGTVSPASNFVRSAEYAGARTIFLNTEPMNPRNPAFQEVYLGRAEELLPCLLGSDATN